MITDEFCEKTRSVHAFIAVCDSARSEMVPTVVRRVVAQLMKYSNATPLRGAGWGNLHAPRPCAVAHGYKHISAMRFFQL